MAMLRFPRPHGARPGVLAERAGMSKQAMNRLLGSLEHLGYIVRSDARGNAGLSDDCWLTRKVMTEQPPAALETAWHRRHW
jgi:DNA-binding IclR family transcriptional regulator